MKTSTARAVRFVAAMAGIMAAAVFGDRATADLVTYQMVTVGDAGNAADSATGNLYGAVAYEYQIGKYDVTIGQYAAFLNAVAKTDNYGLYRAEMASDLNIAGIARSGASGAYVYTVMNNGGNSANRPINYVSWFDAARFVNWMSNGQPTGGQTGATTENGAYALNGAIAGTAPARNATNPNTSTVPGYWIPTENEWYKAAYYDPSLNSGTGGYWTYATRSNSIPGATVGGTANQANFFLESTGPTDHRTNSASYSANQNYLSDVGAFTGSASAYGTFDQNGDVWQWNDLDGTPGNLRGSRGGSWNNGASYMASSFRFTLNAQNDFYVVTGFRLGGPVASTPVPEIDPAGLGSVLALVGGAIGLVERRRRGTTRI